LRAAVCTRYGPPEVLRLEDVEEPVPRGNDLRIRIAATAVTSSDCYVRGLDLGPAYRLLARVALGWSAPRRRILGMVLSGTVDAVGPECRSFRVGDEVLGFNRRLFGTYAEYVCWPEDGLIVLRPPGLPHDHAASLPYGGLLAMHFLRRGGLARGQKVLVYGASGAVGTCAVQLATRSGADVTGVCGPSNLDLVRSLGATRVIDYTTDEIRADADSYDLILDAVGRRKSATAMRHSARALTAGGRSVSVDDGTPKLRRDDLILLADLAAHGALLPVVDRTFELPDIAEAHRYVDTGHKRGNVVVTVAQARRPRGRRERSTSRR
jgi:NADPH:quinone reductase-like Zn-dependent oxidoreductase